MKKCLNCDGSLEEKRKERRERRGVRSDFETMLISSVTEQSEDVISLLKYSIPEKSRKLSTRK